jgi:hypothetical protein
MLDRRLRERGEDVSERQATEAERRAAAATERYLDGLRLRVRWQADVAARLRDRPQGGLAGGASQDVLVGGVGPSA